MRARAIIHSFGLLLLTGCREQVPVLEPIWPPEEGAYCADASGICDADGTPWICGPRPFWQRLDCVDVCAAQNGTPRGCLYQESEDVTATRTRLTPLGFLADPSPDIIARLSSVQCLCQEAANIECAGPSRAICADRSDIWTCGETRIWEKQSCASKCAALDPPMALQECYHSIDYDEDECQCTLIGAPCSTEGQSICAGDASWLRCLNGVWESDISCEYEISCEFPEVAVCDRLSNDAPACRCEE